MTHRILFALVTMVATVAFVPSATASTVPHPPCGTSRGCSEIPKKTTLDPAPVKPITVPHPGCGTPRGCTATR